MYQARLFVFETQKEYGKLDLAKKFTEATLGHWLAPESRMSYIYNKAQWKPRGYISNTTGR